MKLVQLHRKHKPIGINADLITGVMCDDTISVRIYVNGGTEYFYVDESYQEIIKILETTQNEEDK